MAAIMNLQLGINKTQGDARLTVTYFIRGSQLDVLSEQTYREVVELIGVDKGEDSTDEPIPDTRRSFAFVATSTSEIPRTQIYDLPASALDEDRDVDHPREDEIAARVTLIPIPPGTITRNSNIVRRGGLVGPVFV